MLVCISANPAIDKRVCLRKLVPGQVNRASEVRAAAGGKAAHVAMVLRRLGAEPHWIGLAGGARGQELLAGLCDLNISTIPVPMKNATRVNLEIIDADGTVTEILEPGPAVSIEECKAFQSACDAVFRTGKNGVTAIFSGSLPQGLPHGFYRGLIERVHECGGKAFLDSSGEPLRKALEACPDFVKANRDEAEWLTGRAIRGAKSAAAAIAQLISAGAKSAAVSLGQDGLIWKPWRSDSLYFAHGPKLQALSAVGSGDAALAGFAYAAEQRMGTEESLKLAVGCGMANCLAELPGQLSLSEVQRLRELVTIEAVSEPG